MKNNNKLNQVLSAILLASGLSVAGAAQAADVVIGEPNWPSAKVTAYVLKEVIEQELGMEADISPGNNAVIFKAMDSGKGDIDVHPEAWMPNQKSLIDKYTGKGSVTLSNKPYDVVQGYCVTKETADKHGIKSVFDLADEDNARLFDTDGDGRGEVWIGATGWGSTPVEKIRARDYGFAEFFELQELDETLALSKLDTAVKKQEPFVSYCYAPHHIFKLYDLVMLEEPKYDASKWTMVKPTDDPDWMSKSSVSTAWDNANVHVAWSTSLDDRAPEIARLLQNVKLESADISAWIYAMAVEKKDAGEYARAWVQNNPEKVQKWLGF
ncbi:ABC transporter substrate-binding protein [Aliamphritea hakodatensis]|uniref:ABC transporter substrate-binding protein n=1 Tax=Aliamphritea hakodatensis TaxID=2895352 RepID=UPI0022FD73FD|nr:glycine betaine ABC transporter substrate-binding protein [Aliamphritea hakodatensis]